MSNLEIKPCHFGIIFALGIESGCFEDLLSGSVRIRGSGFFIKEGGLKGRRVAIIRSGPGPQNAARAMEVLIDGHRPQIVVSAGFAGGLDPTLKRHDILLVDSVTNSSGEQIILRQALPSPDNANQDQTLATFLFPRDKFAWTNLHTGGLLSLDHVVRDPNEKQALYQRHHALAVDMETFTEAEVCRRRGLPLISARVILDAANDALPPYIERLLNQKSKAARLGAALAAIWRRPASVKDLWALKGNSMACSAQLARFIDQMIGQ